MWLAIDRQRQQGRAEKRGHEACYCCIAASIIRLPFLALSHSHFLTRGPPNVYDLGAIFAVCGWLPRKGSPVTMSESTKRWLAVVRMIVGALFIVNALPKLGAPYLLRFESEVTTWIAGNPFPWFRVFLQEIVLPHSQMAALIIGITEFLAGVCLLVGFLTGLAAIIAFVNTAVMVLATSHLKRGAAFGASPALDTTSIFALLVLLLLIVGKAGRTWGLGARLGSSKSILW